MKRLITTIAALSIALASFATVPHKAKMPDIPGYQTLLGDCHVHTIFTDATVWPDTRVAEADFEGLDFIMMTDHCETRHMKMVNKGYFNGDKVDRNTSYELAAAAAKKRGMIVIHGAEITAGKWIFPGHFNTFFISDGNKLAYAEESEAERVKNLGGTEQAQEEAGLLAALKEARAQGAIIQWNHPDWERQAQNNTMWLPIHTKIYKDGLVDGIEIVNRFSAYNAPAHHWAVEKKLFVTGGTDTHKPMFEDCDWMAGEFRPMTLVFAKERSEAGIREAFEQHRTAVWADDCVYGPQELLEPLFKAIFEISDVKYTEKGLSFKVTNNSSVPLMLRKAEGAEDIVYVRNKHINAGEVETISVAGINNTAPLGKQAVDVIFYVDNFMTDTDVPLKVSFHFDIPAKYVKASDAQVSVSPAFRQVGAR